eukprot:TRINITY_DN426_c1_g2_i1.p1 TRINITY_DN426_c1_g2~~TRINITY_DN426_c1_g2_i1.p1  ORF type:complete len:250 (-),score=56.30 TRINITY_DN426_c1_g2_i1:55-804(-)
MEGRKQFVGGNWKCFGTKASVADLVKVLNEGGELKNSEVVVAPPAIHIPFVKDNLRGDIEVSAQNMWCEAKNGAYTGELCADMIKDFGINWVILGHSERRKFFAESNELVAKKTKIALEAGLKVIPCFGEQLEDREAGKTMEVVKAQTLALIEAIPADKWEDVVFAYEPVWAIGTGKVATPAQAQEVHKDLRAFIAEVAGAEIANKLRIIYGGSVKAANCNELISCEDIDGFLVGGAALQPQFNEIMRC